MKKFIDKLFSIFNSESKAIAIYLPMFILLAFIFVITINNVYTKTYDIERFDRAKETIRSPITIENEVETDRKMRETVSNVVDRYTVSEEITEEQVGLLEELFDAIETIEKEDTNKTPISLEDKTTHLEEILSEELINEIDEVVFMQLFRLDVKDRTKAKKTFIQSVEKTLNNGVRIENIQSAKEEVKSILKYSSLDDETKDAFKELIDFSVVENSFFDIEKTMEARNEAASGVEPVMIRSGDIIVREGQIVTNEIYEELQLVGLLNRGNQILPAIGLLIFATFLLSIITYELNRLYRRQHLTPAKTIAVLFISIITITLMKIMSLYTDQLQSVFLLVPVATGVLLIRLLIYERLAIILAIVYAILGSIIFNGEIPGSLNIESFLYFIFFQLAGIYLLRDVRDRMSIIKTAFGMAIINVMTIMFFLFLSFQQYYFIDFIIHASFGVAAAILSVVLTIGLMPFFETGLGILTDSKLLHLANPNQPLLRKILQDAPGTYHHSVMVANLSETACEAIGANGLLARVGSYYHDIGKTVNPYYFIENQVGIKNPHDFISAKESAEIIIGHVTNGAEMLKKEQLPKEIIDICLQHHGTSLVEYFYRMAEKEGKQVDEADFRYPGPRPQTKEAGVISICDATEAAVRSLDEPSNEKIANIVQNIVNNKLLDGQFNETPLTIKEIHTIRETVCTTLQGIFHSRIQYPDKEE
ncbi:MAG TPA: HDIG domain-containing protein [Candidatus Pseudogracilibacillus intestinigallinarum]|uniref:HDIG domain-containing protein n=1 Tax=Candidatus Pseudogracilibacillus intestinigallinarum TaxID=2838742 RepID=A0A9D1PKC7_9BACI|nr:HDIG domain-containing protein [Candidatus Pseudogracilibacillus intestinigallinarum]